MKRVERSKGLFTPEASAGAGCLGLRSSRSKRNGTAWNARNGGGFFMFFFFFFSSAQWEIKGENKGKVFPLFFPLKTFPQRRPEVSKGAMMGKRMCFGKVPENGVLLGAFPGSGGWMLFELPLKGRDGWRSLKLSAMSPVIGGRANFRLGWNGRRMSASRENQEIHGLDPALLDWVVDTMRASKT